jgi:hypothetical protein
MPLPSSSWTPASRIGQPAIVRKYFHRMSCAHQETSLRDLAANIMDHVPAVRQGSVSAALALAEEQF